MKRLVVVLLLVLVMGGTTLLAAGAKVSDVKKADGYIQRHAVAVEKAEVVLKVSREYIGKAFKLPKKEKTRKTRIAKAFEKRAEAEGKLKEAKAALSVAYAIKAIIVSADEKAKIVQAWSCLRGYEDALEKVNGDVGLAWSYVRKAKGKKAKKLAYKKLNEKRKLQRYARADLKTAWAILKKVLPDQPKIKVEKEVAAKAPKKPVVKKPAKTKKKVVAGKSSKRKSVVKKGTAKRTGKPGSADGK